MDFSYSRKTEALRRRILDFMNEVIYPNEPVYAEQLAAAADRWKSPPGHGGAEDPGPAPPACGTSSSPRAISGRG